MLRSIMSTLRNRTGPGEPPAPAGAGGEPPLDTGAVVAQIEAGVAERETVMSAIADLARRGKSPPLEMKSLEYFISDDPSRIDLKGRLHTVLRLLDQPVPLGLAEELRAHYIAEERAIDYQQMMDEYAASVRYSDMDQAFFPILEDVRRYTMTTVERLYALWTAVQYLVEAEVQGDLVEAGVWRGGSVMLMALELLRSGAMPRPLWLYDTFAGLPRPDAEIDVDVLGNRGIDGWLPRNFSNDTSVWAYADEVDVRANIASTGYPEIMTHFIVGRVEETVAAQCPERLALLRIDTDWYASYAHLLDTLYDRIVPGGVLLLNDYGHMLGARRAVDEFRHKRGIHLPMLRVDYSCRLMIKA